MKKEAHVEKTFRQPTEELARQELCFPPSRCCLCSKNNEDILYRLHFAALVWKTSSFWSRDQNQSWVLDSPSPHAKNLEQSFRTETACFTGFLAIHNGRHQNVWKPSEFANSLSIWTEVRAFGVFWGPPRSRVTGSHIIYISIYTIADMCISQAAWSKQSIGFYHYK